MSVTLWINTAVSIAGILLGIFFASGSVISIANMQVPWAGWLLFTAFGVPVAFAISGVGAWLVYAFGAPQLVMYLVAFPWVYFIAFVAAMILTFNFL